MYVSTNTLTSKRPWNKGKLTGQKPPLQPQQVWAIRTRLQLARKVRDLALFNIAIDSKLRGCDVVRLKIADIAPHGRCIDRATIRQRKTGRPVKFEITEQTRKAVDQHLSDLGPSQSGYLFPGVRKRSSHLTTRQYARLVSQWVSSIGLNPAMYGIRRQLLREGLAKCGHSLTLIRMHAHETGETRRFEDFLNRLIGVGDSHFAA